MKIKSILFTLCILISSRLDLKACCGAESIRANGLAGPINTLPGYTLPEGKTSFIFGTSFINNGRISQSGINTLFATDSEAEDSYGTLRFNLAAAHGFTDKFTAMINIPYTLNFDIREYEDGETEHEGNAIGFGDMTLLGQYNVVHLEESGLDASLLAGIKLPTGNADVKTNDNKPFGTAEQPGTGSFDPLLGVAVSKTLGDFNLDASFLYKLSTEGKLNTDIGDVKKYDIALSYPVHHRPKGSPAKDFNFLERHIPEHIFGKDIGWDLILEINTISRGAPEVEGVAKENYGNTTVYLSPGLRMIYDNRWILNMNVGFPIIDSRDGIQGGEDLQVFVGLGTFI